MSNPARLLARLGAVAVTTTLLVASHDARATGGVLPRQGGADPTRVDVEVAVAVTPFGATRWARLTVGGASDVMWLVPARPGAALDWASDGWLAALHDATAPRVAAPQETPSCVLSLTAERPPPWIKPAKKKIPSAVAVHASESELRAHAASRGFGITAALSGKIAEAYASGYALVSLELRSLGAGASTPTLRVSDDGGAIIPLALTGARQSNVRITAVVLAEGSSALPGTRELDPAFLLWGMNGSTYTTARAAAVGAGGGATWLRESASHEALAAGFIVPDGEATPPLTEAYFRQATGEVRPTCEAAARGAALSTGVVGRACPAGALATVPGGEACTSSTGSIDPGLLACGGGVDDLALALAGTSPAKTVISRFSGLIENHRFGIDLPINASATTASPVLVAGRFEPCVTPAPRPGSSGITQPPSSPTPPPRGSSGSAYRYEGGCSGSSTTVVPVDTSAEDEEVVAEESTETSSSTGDSESCGGSSTGSSSGDWDTSDDDSDDTDDSDDSESCGGGSTGSSSGDWDTSDDDSDDSSGWDSDDSDSSDDSCSSTSSEGDEEAKATRKPRKAGGGRSPVSRLALLFVALVLPLRRRLRIKKL